MNGTPLLKKLYDGDCHVIACCTPKEHVEMQAPLDLTEL